MKLVVPEARLTGLSAGRSVKDDLAVVPFEEQSAALRSAG